MQAPAILPEETERFIGPFPISTQFQIMSVIITFWWHHQIMRSPILLPAACATTKRATWVTKASRYTARAGYDDSTETVYFFFNNETQELFL